MAATAQQRLMPAGDFPVGLVLAGIVMAAIVGVAAGIGAVVLLLALLLAVRVYQHPEETIAAGPLFLMVCEVIFPSQSSIEFYTQPREMYYWAAGLLLITIGALLSLGYSLLFKIPRSLQVYTLVALAASAYGLWNGAEPSYVFRQLYGALLFTIYFAFALRGMTEDAFLRTCRAYAIPCALAFVARYALLLDRYGVHKEWTGLVTQTTMLAIPFAARRGWKWRFAAVIMLVPPALDIMRREFAGFALGLVIVWAFSAQSQRRRRLSWVLAGGIVLASLVPPVVDTILESATQTSVLDQFMPEGTRNASTVVERGMQVISALAVLQNSPIFGSGMGSSLESWRSWGAAIDTPYVDNGWAYLLVKMGLAGVFAFGWFAVNLVSWVPGRSIGLSACLLSMLLLVLFVEPVFFQFGTSPLLGAMAGLLYAGRNQKNSELSQQETLEIAH